MSDPRRARFQTLWESLSTDETLVAHPPGESLRGRPSAPKVIDPTSESTGSSRAASLPRITLEDLSTQGVPPEAEQAARAAHGADLELTRVLGEGGMGKVFLATQRSLAREIAVKVVRHEPADAASVTALLHEARVTGALEHPNIVPVHALGLDSHGRPVMVMKRVEGTPWTELLRDRDHPAWRTLPLRHDDRLLAHIEVLVQLCNAVQFAHTRGVLHRDIKPDNVMIGAHGEVYLLDWGVALRADRGRGPERDASLVGTPMYMAPEMVDPAVGALDARTDVYLLGATLHEALTGRPRHDAASLADTVLAAFLSDPVSYPAAVPSELAQLANDATSRDPSARPQDAAAFRQRLLDYTRHRASLALSDAAAQSLDALRATVPPAPASTTGLERREASELAALAAAESWALMNEARFGFAQALREWPNNSAARVGLQHVLERMIERELQQANAAAAQRLLAELPEPRPALAARIDAAAREGEAMRSRDARLRALQRDMDPMISAASLAAAFTVILVLTVGASVYLVRAAGGAERIPARSMAAVDVFGFAVVCALAAVFRRTVFANAIGRRLTLGLGVQCLGLTATSVLGWALGETAVEILVGRMLVLATSFGVAAIVSIPSVGWLAALSLAGATVTAVWPWTTALVAPGTILALLGVAAFLSATGRLRTRAGDIVA